MINAGAIAAVSLVAGASPDERFSKIQEFIRPSRKAIDLDEDVYRSRRRPETATGRSPTC